jgi:hypothetical protein
VWLFRGINVLVTKFILMFWHFSPSKTIL